MTREEFDRYARSAEAVAAHRAREREHTVNRLLAAAADLDAALVATEGACRKLPVDVAGRHHAALSKLTERTVEDLLAVYDSSPAWSAEVMAEYRARRVRP